MKIRAMVAHAPNTPLVMETLDLAPPGPGQVLIEIMASGLCHTDLSQLEGKAAPYPFPIVVGHEGAGIVRQIRQRGDDGQAGRSRGAAGHRRMRAMRQLPVGADQPVRMLFLGEIMTQPSPFSLNGQKVSAYSGVGSLAEFVVLPEYNTALIRNDIPFHLACTLGCSVATGVGAVLHTAHVPPGSSVAVFGLGGIGLNVVQGARLAGADRIIGVDINPARDAQGRRFGMTDFIDGTAGNTVDAIRALTGGGADFAFECVGHTALMAQAFDATRIGRGCTVVLGVPPDGETLQLVPFAIQLGRTIKGSFMGNIKGRSQLPGLLDHVAEGPAQSCRPGYAPAADGRGQQGFCADEKRRGAAQRGQLQGGSVMVDADALLQSLVADRDIREGLARFCPGDRCQGLGRARHRICGRSDVRLRAWRTQRNRRADRDHADVPRWLWSDAASDRQHFDHDRRLGCRKPAPMSRRGTSGAMIRRAMCSTAMANTQTAGNTARRAGGSYGRDVRWQTHSGDRTILSASFD